MWGALLRSTLAASRTFTAVLPSFEPKFEYDHHAMRGVILTRRTASSSKIAISANPADVGSAFTVVAPKKSGPLEVSMMYIPATRLLGLAPITCNAGRIVVA